jgi:hypothetical protein
MYFSHTANIRYRPLQNEPRFGTASGYYTFLYPNKQGFSLPPETQPSVPAMNEL